MKTIVVYGSGPQDTDELTLVGKLNTEAAAKFFQQEGERIIVTGGLSGKSSFTEAELMKKYLLSKGIPEECIVLEGKAANTVENVVFVANIVDGMGLNCLIHITPKFHMPRVKELNSLMGLDEISEYKISEKLLGENYPLIKATGERVRILAENEPRWMRGLQDIPEYWLPQAAKIESIKRFHYVLGWLRIKNWLEVNFSVFDVSGLSGKEITELRGQILKIKRIKP